MDKGLYPMYIITLKFVNETDKDEALEVLATAEAEGIIMGPYDTQVEQVDDPKPDPEPTIEQAAAKADAFDFARATNLYLLAARDLGTCLGGHSITDLLADRTDWDLERCKIMGDRVVNDQSITDLLAFEGVPEAYDNGER